MIIIEGPDCAGKTTLARGAFPEFHYHHHGPYKGDPLIETILETNALPTNTVWDRLHVGERVYGPIYRDNDRLGDVGHRLVDRYLLSRRGVLIVALPPKDIVITEFEQRKNQEMFGRGDDWQEKLEEQWFRFAAAISASYLPTVKWDHTQGNTVELRELVFGMRPPANPGPGVGDPTPGGILLIGEQGNKNGRLPFEKLRLPFVHRRGCSGWLATQMNEADIDERGLYWINALQEDDQHTDPSFLDQLKPRLVIALGGIARIWCQVHKIAHKHVAHPQHHKRFHHNDPYPLIELLRRATDAEYTNVRQTLRGQI